MSDLFRKRLINSIIVFAIVLLALSLYLGNKISANQEKEEMVEKEKEEQKAQEERYSFTQNETNSESEHETEEHEHQEDDEHEHNYLHGEYEYQDDISVDFNENAKKTVDRLEDFYTKEEIDQSMKLAKNFSENFYSFNGEYPLMYKEKYQFYITDQLKNKLSEGITRPTFQEFYREVQEIHVYESLEANGEYIKLIARINGNVLNQDKSEEKEEIVEYTLQIVKVDDQYKVHDYAYAKLQ